MKFLRTMYWYVTAFLRKQWLLLVGVVVVSIVLFHFLSPLLMAALPEGKATRYIGRVGTITLATLPIDIQKKISDGLTTTGKDQSPMPALAERWSVEDDGRTYRFILKQNIKWQDGKVLEPSDINYNFSDAEVVTTPNEIVFKLKESFAPFPTVVSQPIFREEKNTIIGTGEYRVLKIKKEGAQITQLEIESDEEKLIYRFYPSEDRASVAFKRGEVDILEDLTRIGDLSEWKNVKITEEIRSDRYLALFFNMGEGVLDKDVRQALNYAIPKPDGNERALTPFNPTSWAYNRTVKAYDEDDEHAVELLLRSVSQQKLQIELTATVNFQSDAEAIKEHWEQLGVLAVEKCQSSKAVTDKSLCENLRMEITLRLVGFPDLSNFQIVLVGQEIPPDPDQYYLWDSTQSTNFTRYQSPRIDKLLEDGRKVVDREERKTMYLDFQQFLVEETPAIFIKHLKVYRVER